MLQKPKGTERRPDGPLSSYADYMRSISKIVKIWKILPVSKFYCYLQSSTTRATTCRDPAGELPFATATKPSFTAAARILALVIAA